MGQVLCFFDNKACTSMGECLVCDRFPGEDKAREMVNESRAKERAEREKLVKARDVTQLDPSQFAARIILQWDEAIYGYGSTPDKALHAVEEKFLEMYGFAVRYHELLTAKEE